jgi:hypothetical protein
MGIRCAVCEVGTGSKLHSTQLIYIQHVFFGAIVSVYILQDVNIYFRKLITFLLWRVVPLRQQPYKFLGLIYL